MTYYQRLSQIIGEINNHAESYDLIDNKVLNGNPIVIYGFGKYAKIVYSYLVDILQTKPVCFAEQNVQLHGIRYKDIAINSLSESIKQFGSDINLILTPHVFYKDSKLKADFLSTCQDMGIKNIFDIFPSDFDSLEFFGKIPKEQLLYVLDMLYDDFSKACYFEYIRSIIYSEKYTYSYFDTCLQYFPEDLFTITESDYVVDCGAYDGDTIARVMEKCEGRLRGLAAFEPTPQLFTKMQHCAGKYKNTKIELHQMAVGNESKTVFLFETAATGGNSVQGIGSIPIEMCVLDEILVDKKPSFIKMDIEGSEINALQGARRIIEACHPILAICIYHKPEDLYEIPMFIKRCFPAYRLYVRKYTNSNEELVLYAVPPHRCAENL